MNQGPASPVSGVAARSWVRGKDRRNAWAGLLTTLTRTLQEEPDPYALRKVFERGARQLLPLRWAELREARPTSWCAAAGEVLTLPVATSDGSRAVSLDARIEPGHVLGPWDRQMLEALAAIGALVVEIEHLSRGRPRPALAGGGSRPDAAVPLIGSGAAMHALRERIARVAATDFTVLIEGPIGP